MMTRGCGRFVVSPMAWLAVSVAFVVVFNISSILHLETTSWNSNHDAGNAALRSLLSTFATANGTQHFASSHHEYEKLDLGTMTRSLMDSFTAPGMENEDELPTVAPRQFPRLIVSTNNPNSETEEQPNECKCDLLTVDCIDCIACVPASDDHRHALVHLGIETRSAIKQTARFDGDVIDNPYAPIGKGQQYATMAAWHEWVRENKLPKQYLQEEGHDFINEEFYPSCKTKNRRGKSCFFARMADPEDLRRGLLEKQAIKWFAESKYDKEIIEPIRTRLQEFAAKHRQQLQDVHAAREKLLDEEKRHGGITVPTSDMSPLGQLMMFSHIIRLLFQPRPFLLDIFADKLTVVDPKQEQQSEEEQEGQQQQRQMKDSSAPSPFTVSLHMRRGDSCSFDDDKQQYPYEKESSSLHSPAQTSNVRKCYETEVYLQVLERIREMLPKDQPLHVYLSTDDTGSVMKEIETNHTHVYNVVDQWHFLNYSRSHFQYDLTEFIESDENKNRPIMGETAVSDLWLLSHGQAFIGHLGSRFGKVAWYLATSRHNSFIPYFSVDGHSICCEIDESCGSIRKYVFDMENCLTFSHEFLDKNVGDKYWDVGSLARKSEYRQTFRIKRNKGKEEEQ